MKVLSLGAHPDDIELGCGGTIVRHVARGDEVTILVMTSGGRGTLDGMSRLYETPSTRRFDPSVYIDVSTALDAKLESLRAHLSQVLRAGPVDLEAIEAQARFRGSQGRMRFAEAFEPARLAWDLSTPAALAPVVPIDAARTESAPLHSIG